MAQVEMLVPNFDGVIAADIDATVKCTFATNQCQSKCFG